MSGGSNAIDARALEQREEARIVGQIAAQAQRFTPENPVVLFCNNNTLKSGCTMKSINSKNNANLRWRIRLPGCLPGYYLRIDCVTY